MASQVLSLSFIIVTQKGGLSEKEIYVTRNVFLIALLILSETIINLERILSNIIRDILNSSCKVPGIFYFLTPIFFYRL